MNELRCAWHFYCVNGKMGVMLLQSPVNAKTALAECRLSLGAKVMRVF